MWKNAYWVLYDYEISTEIMPVIAWGGGGGGTRPPFFLDQNFWNQPDSQCPVKGVECPCWSRIGQSMILLCIATGSPSSLIEVGT